MNACWSWPGCVIWNIHTVRLTNDRIVYTIKAGSNDFMNKTTRCCAILALSLFSILVQCTTIENYFAFIHVSMGLESANTAFVVRKHGIVKALAPDLQSTDIRSITDDYIVQRGYFSISSEPEELPFIGDKGFFKYLRTSFTITSPHTFRGTINNYPDSGFGATDPLPLLLLEVYPPGGSAAKKSEFIFEEFRIAFALYFPYFSGDNWYFTLSNSVSQSRYNLDLIEGNTRLATVRDQWTPVHSIGLLYGYRLDHLFSQSQLMRNTFVFVEMVFDNTYRAKPLNIDLHRTNGLPADRLYAQQSYVRLGIRKTISLIDKPIRTSAVKAGDEQTQPVKGTTTSQ
ncbi:MAG: hypothetical protein KDK39_08410 [Leptospiraceae bacterium]|nr:hypothetical protein [Leptospiraceae bacterium]